MEEHAEETESHVDRLEKIFEALDEKRGDVSCAAMTEIVARGKAVIKDRFEDPARDASLIATAQLAEHYEIAAYVSLRLWAKALGLTEAAQLLLESLNDEVSADENLSSLAETVSEKAALSCTRDDDDS